MDLEQSPQQPRPRRPRGRRAEPRIVDPATHPRRYVSLVVAAEYLEMDRRTLNELIDSGLLPYSEHGKRRRVLVADLLAYERSARRTDG